MIEAIIFLFGSAVGSFLNVVICRLETGEGIVKKRSHCPKCGRILAWHDLIPIISFFILRGRCRNCKGKISWQYPLVEIITGVLFLFFSLGALPLGRDFFEVSRIAGLALKSGLQLFYLFFIVSCLIIIFVYDLRHYIIPDKVLWPAIGVALAYRIFDALAINSSQPPLSLRGGEIPPLNLRGGEGELLINVFTIIWPYLLAALVAAAFFMFLVLITRGRGMGLGDVKLTFLMGLILGWPNILIALFLAFFSGALIGVGLIIAGKKTLKSRVPFGPFLILGTLAALFWGQQISGFYLGLFT